MIFFVFVVNQETVPLEGKTTVSVRMEVLIQHLNKISTSLQIPQFFHHHDPL